MSNVGQKERVTQDRVVKFFQNELNYDYLGDWHERKNNRNVEPELLRKWLKKQGVSDNLIGRTLRKLDMAAGLGEGKKLYDANKEVYRMLRYGIKDKEGAGEQNQTVWLVDWQHPENNHFAIAEEVSIEGVNKKRPDIVLYVNGIALAVIELKRSSVSIGEGIRQNLDNQKKDFIRNFFTTMQLVMAGNDTQGLRYGTIETSEKYYLSWKEENPAYNLKTDPISDKFITVEQSTQADNILDFDLLNFCNKKRFLELIHDYIVFDAGVKKLAAKTNFLVCRPHSDMSAAIKVALSGIRRDRVKA
jgi:type I restriction enzyme R subunit